MFVSKKLKVEKIMENVVSDKNRLFAAIETECHHLKVDAESDDILKVWVKQPTWLQVEQALSSIMKLDAQQGMELDLNAMYKFMVENFIEKTEPALSSLELMRLSPFIGNQLKDVLPNPFEDMLGADTGN
tara:strand:+ start:25120 stop:25509 length:390 start_codon:yes stop_codon:yes gene_type:complete